MSSTPALWVRPIPPELVDRLGSRSTWTFSHTLYLIEEECGGAIKVGNAKNPLERISELQIGNPRRLILRQTYFGNRYYCQCAERAVLNNFKAVRGEWIDAPLEDLMAFIESLRAGRN